MLEFSWTQCQSLAKVVAEEIRVKFPYQAIHQRPILGWAVPRGGIYAGLLVKAEAAKIPLDIQLVENPTSADFIIDDLVDSGITKAKILDSIDRPFFALFDKSKEEVQDWIQFPWERVQKSETIQDNVRRILQSIGEDPDRDGLKETPDRVARSYSEIFGGYKMEIGSIFKTFEHDDPESCDEMIICRGIEFESVCEHHLQPFFGTVDIGYIPGRMVQPDLVPANAEPAKPPKVVGLSKLSRVVAAYSKRLQIQERLTSDIANCLEQHLRPWGVGVVIRAKHFCMICRGVKQKRAEMVTSRMTGVFRTEPSARAEFLNLISK